MGINEMFVLVVGLLIGLGNDMAMGGDAQAGTSPPVTQPASLGPNMTPASAPATRPAPVKPTRPISFLPAKNALATVLPEVELTDTTLEAALDFFRESCHLNLLVRWKQLADAGIGKTTNVAVHVKNVSCSQALALVLQECEAQNAGRNARIGFQIQKGIAVVSTREDLNSYTETRTYNVQPLVASMIAQDKAQSRERALEEIEDVIRRNVEPFRMQENPPIKANNGQLVITGTVGTHDGIAALLSRISQAPKNTPPGPADKALAETVKVVDFQDTPLSDVLQSLTKQQGVNIHVNWHALLAVGVNDKTPITIHLQNVKLATAIQKIVEVASPGNPVDYYADANYLHISTRTDLDSNMCTRTYDIRNLLPSDARRAKVLENMVTTIKGTIVPETWADPMKGGAFGSICEVNGLLLVTTCPRAHAGIAEWLKKMRQRK